MHMKDTSCTDGIPLDCCLPPQQARASAATPEATATRSSRPAKPFGAESGRRSVASLMPWREGGDGGGKVKFIYLSITKSLLGMVFCAM